MKKNKNLAKKVNRASMQQIFLRMKLDNNNIEYDINELMSLKDLECSEASSVSK